METITIESKEYDDLIKKLTDNYDKIFKLEKHIKDLKSEIKFLKDSGENILVITKQKNSPNINEFITTEKEIIKLLINENKDVRKQYDEINSKSMKFILDNGILKETNERYKNKINKLEKKLNDIDNLKFFDKIKFIFKKNLKLFN